MSKWFKDFFWFNPSKEKVYNPLDLQRGIIYAILLCNGDLTKFGYVHNQTKLLVE